MRGSGRLVVVALAFGIVSSAHAQQVPPGVATDTVQVRGVSQLVQVIRDRWGVAHIYAFNDWDLFFAQGYMAAHDRLFQLEIWRRQATGTVAELLGPRELKRDIGARLFEYRGDMSEELDHYHPHSRLIIQAFVTGINTYVNEINRHPDRLPIEFKLLGTKPGEWTPDVVISRHQGLLGNLVEELQYGRAVVAVGPTEVKRIAWFHPGDPDLKLDPAIDGTLLSAPILDLYNAFRNPIRFEPTDIVVARNDPDSYRRLAAAADSLAAQSVATEQHDIGSNNWVVSGRLSASGHPMMANDPHRAQSAPSLRSWVHLVAPGWDVIGGGEPEIPGVSIGHNQFGAWGLTIFATDGEDLYVYATNPEDPNQYRYRGVWEPMRTVREVVQIKGQSPVTVRLRFTRHGPVVYEDSAHHVAYAVRAAWLEPGGAPYLASLRMDQATSWADFENACSYAFIPGENMVWADKTGDIGWQAVGIAPIRKNWSGLVPIPGDGRFEWAGYLPIKEKPHILNPQVGFIATANNDLIPFGYAHPDAVGYVWTDPFRFQRIYEVLGTAHGLTIPDMTKLQTDYLSIPARELVPLLKSLSATRPEVEQARNALLDWNFVLDTNSVPAGIYEAWYRRLEEKTRLRFVPAPALPLFPAISTQRLIEWLTTPPTEFGDNAAAARDSIVLGSLDEAVTDLTKRFGADPTNWKWGQVGYHHALIAHPLSPAVSDDVRRRLDLGPAPRGGDGNTVGATGGADNQTAGASFRIVADVGNWDAAVGINNPGQVGDPQSPHYRDLFELWSADQYFPVAYSRAHVVTAAESVTMIVPIAPLHPK